MTSWNMEDMHALGSLINSSFGKSSINNAGYGVKATIVGSSVEEEQVNPILEIRFETLVNFNPRHGMQNQVKEVDRNCNKMLEEKLKEIKKEFKESAGKTLKATKRYEQEKPNVVHISHNADLVRAKYSRLIQYELIV